jgi:uncharacterized protein (DUF362 family)
MNIQKNSRIIVKINLCDFRPPETGAITHPRFLDAVLKYLNRNFANHEIYVVESEATSAAPDLFIEWFGFKPILRKYGAHWANLSKTPRVEKKIDGRHFRRLWISELFDDSFFITLPKLKTHSITKITCALKNQFGCLVEKRKIKFHRFLDDAIVDANMAMRPHFCIVDGIVGLGTARGPAWGIPIKSGSIIAGSDPVAVDCACSKIVGFNPYFIGHVRKAAASKIGSMKYQIVGDSLSSVRTNFQFSAFDWYTFRLASFLKDRAVRVRKNTDKVYHG